MQILINEKSEIISYVYIGSFENGITVEIPDSVLNDNPLSYLYLNGSFIKNTDYTSPLETAEPAAQSEITISDLALAITELAEMMTEVVNNG